MTDETPHYREIYRLCLAAALERERQRTIARIADLIGSDADVSELGTLSNMELINIEIDVLDKTMSAVQWQDLLDKSLDQ